MALNAALDCGIKGSGTQSGKNVNINKGLIVVHGVEHLIETPRDPKTGMPDGKPSHGSLAITKTVDLASAKLREKMLAGELIGKATLNFWRQNPEGGSEETHYSIVLTGARVVSIRLFSLNMAIEPLLPDMEEVRFSYKDIKWKYHGTERTGDGKYAKLTGEGGEENVNAAPDDMDAWAREMVLGAGKELAGYVGDTVKAQFAALVAEIKAGSQPVPPPNP